MKKRNRNSKSPLWYIFTLLSFGAGVLLYIFLRRGKKNGGLKSVVSKKNTAKKASPKKNVNNIDNKDIEKLNTRQKKILAVLKEKSEVSMSDLKVLLPDVSVRTVRRDMDKLESIKMAKQHGSTRSTYYTYTGK